MAPILFIHGFPFDGTMWDHQRDAGFPMLAPDLPGFGKSTAPSPASPSIEAYADAVLQIIRQQKEKPIVAGLSMGGYILLALLRQHAAELAGAILIDSRAEADTPEARANRLNSIEDIRAHGTANVINGLMARLLAPNATDAVKAETRAIMERQSPTAVIVAQSAMANRRDQADLLPQLKLPTLIIVGEKDIMTPPSAARAMHAAIPGSQLIEIPDAGHMSPMENPPAVNAALREFAAKVAGTLRVPSASKSNEPPRRHTSSAHASCRPNRRHHIRRQNLLLLPRHEILNLHHAALPFSRRKNHRHLRPARRRILQQLADIFRRLV